MPGLPALTLLSLGGLEEVWAQLRLHQQEGMLRDLQKSVEEEEQVWKAKLTASEEELQKVRVWGTPGFVTRGAGLRAAEGLLAINHTVTLNCSCQPGTPETQRLSLLPKSTPPVTKPSDKKPASCRS